MKTKFAHVAVIMIGMLVLSLLVASTAGANGTLVQLDAVNIGDITSEVGHNLVGWSDPWTWGGGYGGGDDGTFRLLMGPGDGCAETDRDAYFTMNANGGLANRLVLRHLDGSAPDDFDVYVQDGEDWTLIGHYDQQSTIEEWVNSEYTFSLRWGEIQFKLLATEPVASWCLGWGQVAFSWAELYGPVLATIDIDPNTLNLMSEGSIITAFIELPEGFDVGEIDSSSILLNGSVPAIEPFTIGNYDEDGLLDLMVKFDRDDFPDDFETGDSVEITITGQVAGIDFVGTDGIRVISVGERHRSVDGASVVY